MPKVTEAIGRDRANQNRQPAVIIEEKMLQRCAIGFIETDIEMRPQMRSFTGVHKLAHLGEMTKMTPQRRL